MDSGSRRRGCSFHEEFETNSSSSSISANKIEEGGGRRQSGMSGGSYKSQLQVSTDMQTPFEFSADDFDDFDDIPHIKGNYSGEFVGEADDEEDVIPRGRARSRSLNEADEISLLHPFKAGQSEKNAASTVSPAKPTNSTTQASSTTPILIPVPAGNKCTFSSKDRRDSLERLTGPLQIKEIAALQKGLEEANHAARSSLEEVRSLNLNDTELELERIDAEIERAERLSGLSGSFTGSSRSPGSFQFSSSPGSPGGENVPLSVSDKTLRRIKLLVLGDSGVGKSSLILRWTMDKFRPTLISTVGVNFKNKRTLIEGESVIVQVWDTAGQPEFHTITKSYYKGANGIMLLYDVSDHKSFSNIDYWIKCIKENAQENVNMVLVGNKSDLRIRNEENFISFEAGHNIASKYNVTFIETSAKDSKNVDNAFLYLAKATLGLDISPSSHAAARNSLLSKLRSKSDEPSASTSPGNTHVTRSNSGGSSSRSISSISSGSENNSSSSSSNSSSNSNSGNNDSSGDTSISDSANKNPEKCTIS